MSEAGGIPIGFVGLGRMGKPMVVRLLDRGFRVVAYDIAPEPVREVEALGATGARSLMEVVEALRPPRIVWVMIPAGNPTAQVIEGLAHHMASGDIVIDGGNSYYKDSMARAEALKKRGISLLDVGTSGGILGGERGYCFTVGGEREAYDKVRPLFEALAAEGAYEHVGANGAGHYVKMIHNAMEYGAMQVYGEGFELLQKSGFELDLLKVVRTWNRGAMIRSQLLELLERAFERDPNLSRVVGYVEDTGMGRWSVIDAVERGVPFTMTAFALFSRFRSRQEDSFAGKVVAALRREFGGHLVRERV